MRSLVTNTTSLKEKLSSPSLWICRDRPDWRAYAWNNSNKVLYGPVSSRRLGLSLGINLFPTGKVCSFNCIYCDLDVKLDASGYAQLMPTEQLLNRLDREFHSYLKAGGETPDSITFAGNGEPTLHPGFAEMVKIAKRLRDQYFPETPLNLFTDGVHLVQEGVIQCLDDFSRVFLKVDGGSMATVEIVNGSDAWMATMQAVKVGQSLRNVAASTIVISGASGNAEDILGEGYSQLLHILRPLEIYLYTLDYPTVRSDISPVSLDFLMECAYSVATRIESPVIALWRHHRHPTLEGRNFHE
ncbi:MAG: hypothetical protein DRH43_02330 [Deltaproteobacteria bacterium]|nr:MAG: hypothetical protein DRH43_02330 [Deltaproteobacteria bacterium]